MCQDCPFDKKEKLLELARTGYFKFLKVLENDLEDMLSSTSYEDTLIWLWQQNARQCYDTFLKALFKPNKDKSLVLYRGVNGVNSNSYNEDRLILSSSFSYEVAKNFALYRSNYIDNNSIKVDKKYGVVLSMYASQILDLKENGFGIVDNEQEVLVMDYSISNIEDAKI